MIIVNTYVLLFYIFNIKCSTGNYFDSEANKGLTVVPAIPRDATSIDLGNNAFTSFPAESLRGLYGVIVINLKYNLLTTFPNLTYVASTLARLKLPFNQISVIEHDNLNMLTKIEVINLSNNLISHIPDATGPGQTLKILNLSNNNFIRIPKLRYIGSHISTLMLLNNFINYTEPNDFLEMQSLKFVVLAANQLTEYPNLTFVGETVVKIDLYNNQISDIPYELLCETQNLSSLNIANSGGPIDLSSLKKTASNGKECKSLLDIVLISTKLTSLQGLNFIGNILKSVDGSYNKISYLSGAEFDGMTRLTTFRLSYNSLTTFPNLSDARNTLETLALDNNKLTFINPHYLDNMVRLSNLILHDNILTYFPDSKGLTLYQLNLSKNNFTSIPQLPNIGKSLIILNMSENYITVIKNGTLSSFIKLQQLLLGHNKLTTLPDLRELPASINVTDFNSNQINSIKPDYFQLINNTNNVLINLESNNLQYIPILLAASSTIEASGNNLTCNNNLAWPKILSNIQLKGRCAMPEKLYNVDYALVNVSDLSIFTIITGHLQDELMLHDPDTKTCSTVLPGSIINVYAPRITQILFKLNAYATNSQNAPNGVLQLTVVYNGQGCSSNYVTVYTLLGGFTDISDNQCVVNKITDCSLKSAFTVNSHIECVFTCPISSNTFISFSPREDLSICYFQYNYV